MARMELEQLSEREVVRVCAASGAEEAKRIEKVLNAHEVDFAVEQETFRESKFGFSATDGLVFYVSAADAPGVREILTGAGIAAGVVDQDLLDY